MRQELLSSVKRDSIERSFCRWRRIRWAQSVHLLPETLDSSVKNGDVVPRASQRIRYFHYQNGQFLLHFQPSLLQKIINNHRNAFSFHSHTRYIAELMRRDLPWVAVSLCFRRWRNCLLPDKREENLTLPYLLTLLSFECRPPRRRESRRRQLLIFHLFCKLLIREAFACKKSRTKGALLYH